MAVGSSHRGRVWGLDARPTLPSLGGANHSKRKQVGGSAATSSSHEGASAAAEQLCARVLREVDPEAGEVAVGPVGIEELPPSTSTTTATVRAGEAFACSLQAKWQNSMVVTGKSSSHQARSLRVTKPNRPGGEPAPTAAPRGRTSSCSQTVLRVARQADAEAAEGDRVFSAATTRTYPAGGKPERSPLKRRRRELS